MATNIETQEQLNELLREFVKLTEEANKSLKGMFASSRDVATEFQKVKPEGATKSFSEIGEVLEEVQEIMEETGGVSKETFEAVNDAVEQSIFKTTKFQENLAKLPPLLHSIATAGAVFGGFIGGLKISVGAMGDFVGAAQGILGSLGQLAISILTFPFKVLEGLLSMGGGGGGGGLAEALNEVRKEFGSLKKDAGGAIREMARSMRGELAETGLRVRRIFGNLADRLKTLLEYAKNVGPVFDLLRDSFARNAEAVGAYYKGLGLLEDGQRGLAERAQAVGTTVTEQLRQVANFSLRMGEQFGLTAKLISREMGEMSKDFLRFGHLSVQELAQTAVYARKLGIEVKSLGGIMDKYLNFEDAAQGAAQLSQAFGLNVDALALIKAQNPAEQVDMIRKAFFAAGNSIERMNRQERKLLATQTGLEEANLDLVFSAKNQAFSYDQVKKSGDAAARSQMSQEEAMRKLRDSIERLVKGGGGTNFKGFIDAFVKGFARGIRMTREFRRFLRGLKRSVWQTFYAGREVGRAFVKLFPGVSQFFVGLRGIFDPRKFRVLRRGVVQVFKEFFKDLDFKKFMDGIRKSFLNYFDMASPAAKKVVDGVKRFTKAFTTIFTQVLQEGIKGATKVVRFLIDLITGKANLSAVASAGGGIGEWVLQNVIDPVWSMLKREAPALGQALWELLQIVFQKTKSLVVSNLGWIALVFFGPAVTKALIQGFTVSVGGALVRGVGNVFLRGAGGFLSNAASAFLGGFGGKFNRDVARRLPATIRPGLQAASDAITAGGSASGAARQALAAGKPSFYMVKNLALMGLVLVALTGALGLIAFSFKSAGLTVSDFKTTAIAVGLAAGLMLAISASMLVLSATGGVLDASAGGAVPLLLTGLIAVGAVGAALAVGMRAAVDYLKGLSPAEVGTATLALGAATALAVGLSGAVLALTGAGLAVAGPQVVLTAAGLVAVGGLAYGLAQVAKVAVSELGKLDTGAVIKTAAIMTAMGVFVGGLAVLMQALAVSGAVIATGIGAVGIVVGVAGMVLLVEGLKTQVTALIDTVRGIPTDQRFIKQLDLFSKVIVALGGVSGMLAGAIDAATPSFGELLTWNSGGSESFAGRAESLKVFMATIRGSISGLTREVLTLATEQTTAALRKAEPVVNVLSAVATLAQALAGPAEMLRNTAPLGGVLYNDIPTKIALMTGFLTGTATALNRLLLIVSQDLLPVITRAGATLTGNQLQVFKGFAEIIGAIGGLIRSFTATALVGVISRFEDSDGTRLTKGIEAYGRAVNSVTGALTRDRGFFYKVGVLVSALTITAGSLDAGQVKSAAAMAPIISSTFGFLSSIIGLLSNLPLGNLVGGAGGNVENLARSIDPVIRGITSVFGSIKDTAVDLLRQSRDIASTITPTQAKNMKGAFQALGAFFEALKAIPELLSSLRTSVGDQGSVADQQSRLRGFLGALTGQGTGLFSTLGTMISQVQSQLAQIPDVRDLRSRIQAAGDVLNTVKLLGEVMKTFGGEEGQPMQLKSAVSEQVANAVSAMVRSVNEVSAELHAVKVPNLRADLRALGGTLGIGASDRFEIKNRHFNITINLEVIMKSDQIEQALVNSNSRVLVRE